jgi:hypothetical protein
MPAGFDRRIAGKGVAGDAGVFGAAEALEAATPEARGRLRTRIGSIDARLTAAFDLGDRNSATLMSYPNLPMPPGGNRW